MMQEIDPTGKDAKTPGAKLDSGKADVILMLNGFTNVLKSLPEWGPGHHPVMRDTVFWELASEFALDFEKNVETDLATFQFEQFVAHCLLSLCPVDESAPYPTALLKIAKVTAFGAEKYSPNGWLSVPNALYRYYNAMLRHHLAYISGEVLDKDSGLPHLAHRAWNALAVLELHLRKIKAGALTALLLSLSQ